MREVNTIVHLGAGYCSELEQYLEMNPERIVLVESDPMVAEELQARTSNLEKCQVINCAVAPKSYLGVIYQYNHSLLSGLCQVNEIACSLMPGLRLIDQYSTETVEPEKLITKHAIERESDNLLVVDTPGIELPLLQSMATANVLHVFNQLMLHCHRIPFHTGDSKADLVLEWLYAQGYELISQNEENDIDRPTWTLKLNNYKIENLAMVKDLETKVTLINELETKIERLQAEKVEQKKLANGRSVKIEQLTGALTDQKKLSESLQSQIVELKNSTTEQDKTISDLQSTNEQLQSAKVEQTNLANERSVKIEQLTGALADQKKLSESLQSEIVELKNNKIEQERAVCELQSEIDSLRIEKSNKEKMASNLETTLQEKDKEIENLKQQLDELNYRLPMIDEEFVKAEAQIELIKDILIREKAF